MSTALRDLAAVPARFGCILADPPWAYGANSPFRSTVDPYYNTLSETEIKGLPVQPLAARDAVLLLWATNPCLPEALAVLSAWGFTYKSKLTWVKMSRAAAPRIGLGYHARACTEELLIGTRGNPGAPAVADRPAGAFFCPPGAHSAKPDVQYDLAENYGGPYLELFHRPREGGLFPPRPGWTFLGNEVDGQDIRDALAGLSAPEAPR